MYIGIDLGTTNIKAALYDSELRLLKRCSHTVAYHRKDGFIEFDAEQYYHELLMLLRELTDAHPAQPVAQIALTGQAESLVILDANGKPLLRAISWMDERSQEECEILARQFSPREVLETTGQRAILPTWPATKVLWFRKHRPEIFRKAGQILLLKDYIVYRLTGVQAADMSIASFTLYFDVYRKHYWTEMLDAVGISPSLLPPLSEPCTVIGPLCRNAAAYLGLGTDTQVNIGTLDHFAGMIGSGNTVCGGVTLSTGTVMSLAAMAENPVLPGSGALYGFLPDTYVMLPVVESGGASLEWFRRTCLGGTSFTEIDQEAAIRTPGNLLFLPYLVGTNAPEFDADATGVFWGLRQEHDAYDMSRAVMEGVAFVLRKNVEAIRQSGTELKSIIATGGGAKSALWCQIQADITGLRVLIPKERESACLGAAIIAAVGDGRYDSFSDAARKCVSYPETFTPQPTEDIERKYRRFCALYDMSRSVFRIDG